MVVPVHHLIRLWEHSKHSFVYCFCFYVNSNSGECYITAHATPHNIAHQLGLLGEPWMAPLPTLHTPPFLLSFPVLLSLSFPSLPSSCLPLPSFLPFSFFSLFASCCIEATVTHAYPGNRHSYTLCVWVCIRHSCVCTGLWPWQHPMWWHHKDLIGYTNGVVR